MGPVEDKLDFTQFPAFVEEVLGLNHSNWQENILKELLKTKVKQTYRVTTCSNDNFLERYVWLFLMSGNIECRVTCSDETEAKQLSKKVADYIQEWNDRFYSSPHTNEHSTK